MLLFVFIYETGFLWGIVNVNSGVTFLRSIHISRLFSYYVADESLKKKGRKSDDLIDYYR